jgi:hypothetical protein
MSRCSQGGSCLSPDSMFTQMNRFASVPDFSIPTGCHIRCARRCPADAVPDQFVSRVRRFALRRIVFRNDADVHIIQSQ